MRHRHAYKCIHQEKHMTPYSMIELEIPLGGSLERFRCKGVSCSIRGVVVESVALWRLLTYVVCLFLS